MKSYKQFCPAARALDVVGERWSMLLVRELLSGPKRYTDLRDGLPGVGPNLLAERLRSLTQAGVVAQRRLPPPAASTVYELTPLGEGLRPVLGALFQWGLQLLDGPAPGEAVRASYWLPALEAAARGREIPADVEDTYELRVGGHAITAVVRGAAVKLRDGEAEAPDVRVHLDAGTLAEIGSGRRTVEQAIAAGGLRVEGDPQAAERCAAIFAPAQRAVAGAR